jgi:hypothetical protein
MDTYAIVTEKQIFWRLRLELVDNEGVELCGGNSNFSQQRSLRLARELPWRNGKRPELTRLMLLFDKPSQRPMKTPKGLRSLTCAHFSRASHVFGFPR